MDLAEIARYFGRLVLARYLVDSDKPGCKSYLLLGKFMKDTMKKICDRVYYLSGEGQVKDIEVFQN